MHMQTRVMAKGVKEELEGMFVIPNMDWLHCEQRHPIFIGWTQWSLYGGKCKGRKITVGITVGLPTEETSRASATQVVGERVYMAANSSPGSWLPRLCLRDSCLQETLLHDLFGSVDPISSISTL
jgi:hypothetical protein